MRKKTKKIRVGIVDDSPLMRRLLMEAISAEEDMEVAGEASNPFEAREMIKTKNIDIITLDVEMPKMDGISFLGKIMKLRPMPVIMVSTLTHEGADTTLKALEMGAVDYVGKPLGRQHSFAEFRSSIVEKIRAASVARVGNPTKPAPRSAAKRHGEAISLIAIGASTGGVERLRNIFSALPGDLPPIVVVQHMTAQFIPNFSARLDTISAVQVSVPVGDTILKPGHAYVASNLAHLEIRGAHPGPYRAALVDKPPVSGHIASVNVMFDSVSRQAGKHAMGIILSGMGDDGAAGLKSLFDEGGYTLGESEQSCLIYGMPRCAKEKGGVKLEMTLDEIISEIKTLSNQNNFRKGEIL